MKGQFEKVKVKEKLKKNKKGQDWGEQGHLPRRMSSSKICEIQGENSTISVNSSQQATSSSRV